MVCCHTVLHVQMAEVSWVWYCVTLVVGGGIVVIMACWNVCRLSDSLCSPQALWRSCRLVINVPVGLMLDQLYGRVCMSSLMLVSLVVSAAMRWVMDEVWFGGTSGFGVTMTFPSGWAFGVFG